METRRLSKEPAEYSKFYNGTWYTPTGYEVYFNDVWWYEYEDEYGDTIIYLN